MRTSNDEPALLAHGDHGGREPGADHDFPDCCEACPVVIVEHDDPVLYGLEGEAIVAMIDASRSACLHRCPGWPDRRREPA